MPEFNAADLDVVISLYPPAASHDPHHAPLLAALGPVTGKLSPAELAAIAGLITSDVWGNKDVLEAVAAISRNAP